MLALTKFLSTLREINLILYLPAVSVVSSNPCAVSSPRIKISFFLLSTCSIGSYLLKNYYISTKSLATKTVKSNTIFRIFLPTNINIY